MEILDVQEALETIDQIEAVHCLDPSYDKTAGGCITSHISLRAKLLIVREWASFNIKHCPCGTKNRLNPPRVCYIDCV